MLPMLPQHGPFSLHTMLEGPCLPKAAFPTPMVRPLDESQGSSPLQGHGNGRGKPTASSLSADGFPLVAGPNF